MIIDFKNAHHLVRGEAYVISLPEMPLENMESIRNGLEDFMRNTDTKLMVIVGEDIVFNPHQIVPMKKAN